MEGTGVNYQAEELLPVIRQLTERYTNMESTSITYERAQQLMEAVIYCIQEGDRYAAAAEGDAGTQVRRQDANVPVMEAYQVGYQAVLQRVRETSAMYAHMMQSFHHYGNTACYDTVVKGIPAFFQHYDALFCPQDHILTLDYPVLEDWSGLCGIDAISRYISNIDAEQRFLQAFSQEEIYAVLISKHRDYEEMFVNIGEIVLRKLLGCMLLKRGRMKEPLTKTEYAGLKQRIEKITDEQGKEGLAACLEELLAALVESGFKGDRTLFLYLKNAIPDFAAELFNGAEYDCLEQVV